MSIAYLLTTLVVVATPGTGVVYTLSAALSRGRGASFFAAVGCALGTLPHMVATITGLAALMNTSATAFRVVKYLGVAYLGYLAWRTLRESGGLTVETDTPHRSPARIVGSAVLVNLLNPKLTIFFLAFLPQFVDTGAPGSLVPMLQLSAVFTAMTFAVFAGYGILAASVRQHVISRPKVMTWVRRVFAGSFVALGVKLAFADR